MEESRYVKLTDSQLIDSTVQFLKGDLGCYLSDDNLVLCSLNDVKEFGLNCVLHIFTDNNIAICKVLNGVVSHMDTYHKFKGGNNYEN